MPLKKKKRLSKLKIMLSNNHTFTNLNSDTLSWMGQEKGKVIPSK